jgi:hypothetical protein
MSAISSGEWGLIVGFVVMLIVWFVKKRIPKLNKDFLPYASILVASLVPVGGALIAGSSFLEAISVGISAGLIACGQWEIFKKLNWLNTIWLFIKKWLTKEGK